METVITDREGRAIALRKVGVLETLRLYKALGPELAVNAAYVDLARAALFAAMIDGVPLPLPVSEAAVEAVLERLGEAGVEAIIQAQMPVPVAAVMAAAGN